MRNEEEYNILRDIVNGIDPVTGAPIPRENFSQNPVVLRALYSGMMAMRDNPPERIVLQSPIRKFRTRPWTDVEKDMAIRLRQENIAVDDIAHMLLRSRKSVEKVLQGRLSRNKRSKRADDSIFSRSGVMWEPKDEDQLQYYYRLHMSVREIASELKRTPYAVFLHMEKRGYYGVEYGYPVYDENGLWTKADTNNLRLFHEMQMSCEDIAEIMGRPRHNVRARIEYIEMSHKMLNESAKG